MTAKPATCECTAAYHAVDGVKARGIELLVCGAEIDPKHVICRPCAIGNHARVVCPEYVPQPVAAHLDRRCSRCGFDSAKHPIPHELGGSTKPTPPEPPAYGRGAWSTREDGAAVFDVVAAAAAAEAPRITVGRFRRWLASMIPAAIELDLPPLPEPPEELDVLEFESASGRQVTATERVELGEVLAIGRAPCRRCGRPTTDLPTLPSRAPAWEFTRCPRCHRSTLHRTGIGHPDDAQAIA